MANLAPNLKECAFCYSQKVNFGIGEVVDEGICIGCGVCSAATNGRIQVRIGLRGHPEATLRGVAGRDIDVGNRVCPFSDSNQNETQIASALFPNLPTDPIIGSFHTLSATRITDEEKLLQSSSGGTTTFFLEQLMNKNDIDGVLHVGKSTGSELFEYTLSRGVSEIRAGTKSVYYAVSLDQILLSLDKVEGRFAVVGVPCFIKALRLLCNVKPEFKPKLSVFVGLVCGHLKSRFYAESLAWQAGVEPRVLKRLDFRIKDSSQSAINYSFEAERLDGSREVKPSRDVPDAHWGYGAFQPNACNYCDDIFAETADVVFADAWLPEYEKDWRGTNVVITRSELHEQIISEGVDTGALFRESLTREQVVASQAGNVRHRRDGLAIRLADDEAVNRKHPSKRVTGGYSHVTKSRVRLVRQRRQMSVLSFQAFAAAKGAHNLNLYLKALKPEIRKYKILDFLSLSPYKKLRFMARQVLVLLNVK